MSITYPADHSECQATIERLQAEVDRLTALVATLEPDAKRYRALFPAFFAWRQS